MPRFLTQEEGDAWKDDHGQRVNAGDAATILCEGKWEKNPYRAFLYKAGLWARPTQTKEMAYGNAVEPIVFDWYCQTKSVTGVSQAWACYDDLEWVQAKVDFWNAEIRHGAEFKSPTRDDSADHLYALKNKFPPYHYYLQCLHEMEVFDAATWDFVSWRSPTDNIIIPIKRDTDFWLMEMLPAYMQFKEWLDSGEFPVPKGKAADDTYERLTHLRHYFAAKDARAVAQENMDRESAWLMRDSLGAKYTESSIGRVRWEEWRPKSQVNLTFDKPEDAAWVMERLLADQGIIDRVRFDKDTHKPTIWQTDSPPNLVFKIEEKN